jgi:hypothetical protein
MSGKTIDLVGIALSPSAKQTLQQISQVGDKKSGRLFSPSKILAETPQNRYHRVRHHNKTRLSTLNYDPKMAKFSIPHSFEPTESLKHNHTPKKLLF